MLRYPDRQQSRIVLIGTSDYERSDKLPALPAIRNNLTGLMEAFTNPVTGVFPQDRCTVVDTPDSPKSLMQRLRRAAGETEDTLIIYYAGHGLLGWGTKLYLSVRETDPDQLDGTAVPFEWIRDAIQDSPARIKVLILDCCFSGRAIGAMSSDSAALDQIDVTGTTVFTSTTANEVSHSLLDDRYTAFTGELIRILTEFNDGPLYLGGLYRPLRAAMVRRGLPQPRSKVGDSSGSLVLRRWLPPHPSGSDIPAMLPISNSQPPEKVEAPRTDGWRTSPTQTPRGPVPASTQTQRGPAPASTQTPRRQGSSPVQVVASAVSAIASFSSAIPWARYRPRRATPALLICIWSFSFLIAAGVFATGLIQTIQGKDERSFGAAIVALIFVFGWALASTFLLVRTIRKSPRRSSVRTPTQGPRGIR